MVVFKNFNLFLYLMSSNESHSPVKMIFLVAVPSCSHTTSVKPHGRLYPPLMFSLRYAAILTAVQKYSVAPMFVCLAYGLLRLQSHACTKDGSEGTKPWPGCAVLKTSS